MKFRYVIFSIIVIVTLIFGYQGVSSILTLHRYKSDIKKYSDTINTSLEKSKAMVNAKELESSVSSLPGFNSVDCVFDMNSDLTVNKKIDIVDVPNLDGVHLLEVYINTDDMEGTVKALKDSNLLIAGLYVSDNLMIRLYVKGE